MKHASDPHSNPLTDPPRSWKSALLIFASGALCPLLIAVAIYFVIRMTNSTGILPERPVKSETALLAEMDATLKAAADENRMEIEMQVQTLYERQQHEPNCTLDLLIISGGGDNGAFGTGFLVGWGKVPPGPNARPLFDSVSGVSVGGLIAPFAFLGSDVDYERVDELFRNPKTDWKIPRGMLYFLPENSSFYDVAGLERDLFSQIDLKFAEQIVNASKKSRQLLIQSTNLDSGIPHIFDFTDAAKEAVSTGNPKTLTEILLATSAIPVAYIPREINGSLFADGALSSNIFYGGTMNRAETFGAIWKIQHPNAPIPKTRYWVLLNIYEQEPPYTVQPNWLNILKRSFSLAISSAQVIGLRQLFSLAELTKLRGDGDVEVRWVGIPKSWKPINSEFFNQEKMRSLSDLGRRMGADPNSWITVPPSRTRG